MSENSSAKPKAKLIGEDGNVFNIIHIVSQALHRAGLEEQKNEWQKKAMSCGSYDEVLQLMFDYVEVE